MSDIKAFVEKLTFVNLVSSIRKAHDLFSAQANKAVNANLTMRNWAIGYYIERYERSGVDRAKYGEKLMDDLSDSLKNQGLPRCDRRELYRYRKFYLTYPYIGEALSPQLAIDERSSQTVSSLFPNFEKSNKIVETMSPQLRNDGQNLLSSLSFSHFTEILELDDPLKRVFYEVECIRGGWSVRELRRQIATLYYERSGLSTDKNKLAALVQSKAEKAESRLTIRDPYVFEFLGFNAKEVMDESDVEKALLDKLQEFLLELGHGFCFEARQKRILIGSRYFFIDLVFYHRVIKCHVLIELKVDEFTHEHLGQLNTYVSWFKKNVMLEGDNPPVGILLCTQKDHALLEYALAGLDNNLFVSKYLLELPKKEEMQEFIEEQMKEVKK
ncbi:MAG TPA: PDDEXK nuclease domain-containing protein [Candidatus Kapabacteria bacterium]|nr:PDDEXK nuclease domain-containing protein [Candidatus Kapabacteria bacterium]